MKYGLSWFGLHCFINKEKNWTNSIDLNEIQDNHLVAQLTKLYFLLLSVERWGLPPFYQEGFFPKHPSTWCVNR